MKSHTVVSPAEWLVARRALPWERVDKVYEFQTADGSRDLGGLFDGRSQLVVYHFMLGPDWEAGCKSCSFWADNFDGIDTHLAHRDVTLLAISQAPLPRIEAYRRRMGWRFRWVSSFGSDFNFDYQVSFRPEQIATGTVMHNYEQRTTSMTELAGISAFCRDPAGIVYHTYSCYSRGLDMLNGAYHFLDLVAKGRDEDELPSTMAWLRRRDEY